MIVGLASLEQLANNREGLAEATDPVVEGEAEALVLRLVPAGADAENEAAVTDLVDRRRLLGDHGRAVESETGDQGAELDPPRNGSQCAQSRPRLERTTWLPLLALVAVHQVIAEPDRVEPDIFGDPGHLGQLRPRVLVLDLGELHPNLQWPRHDLPLVRNKRSARLPRPAGCVGKSVLGRQPPRQPRRHRPAGDRGPW
jgi:hypothetical protein